MRAFVLVTIVALAIGCAKNKPASYVVTGHAAYGAALGPANSSGGMTTGARIRDRNGLITRNLLVLLVATSKARVKGTENYQRFERTSCSNGVCTTTYGVERSGTTYTAEEPTDQAVEEMREFVKLLDSTDFVPLETTVDIAYDALGGDTRGLMVSMEYRGEPFKLGPFPAFTLGYGMGVGQMKFKGRTTRQVSVDAMGTITGADSPGDYNYNFFGFPIRFDAHYGPLSLFLKVDLNTFTLLELFTGERESPSPWHFGSTYRFGPLFLGAEMTFTALRPGSVTFGAEAGFAF